MKESVFPATSDYVKFAEFIVAYGNHLERERYQQPAMSGQCYNGYTINF